MSAPQTTSKADPKAVSAHGIAAAMAADSSRPLDMLIIAKRLDEGVLDSANVLPRRQSARLLPLICQESQTFLLGSFGAVISATCCSDMLPANTCRLLHLQLPCALCCTGLYGGGQEGLDALVHDIHYVCNLWSAGCRRRGSRCG